MARLVYGIIMCGLGVIALICGFLFVGFKPKSVQFLIEVEQEVQKVTWPGRPDIIRLTIIIAIVTVLLSLVSLLLIPSMAGLSRSTV